MLGMAGIRRRLGVQIRAGPVDGLNERIEEVLLDALGIRVLLFLA
jgi:hypothetical protein